MQKKIIKLKYPLKIGTTNGNEAEISEIQLRRVQARDLKKLPPDFFSGMSDNSKFKINPVEVLPVISSISGIDEDVLDTIDAEDMMNVMEEFTSIMEKQLSPKA
jgi:hypothetical protein